MTLQRCCACQELRHAFYARKSKQGATQYLCLNCSEQLFPSMAKKVLQAFLDEVKRLKEAAIADGTFELPNPSTIIRNVGISSGYLQQKTEAAKKARDAYKQAAIELSVAQNLPKLKQEVEALRMLLAQREERISELEVNNAKLQQRVEAFELLEDKRRSLEAEFNHLRSVA